MISATSFDIQVLGKLGEKDPSAEGKYFIVLKVGEDEAIVSGDALPREPGPGWKEEQPFKFDVWSEINMEIFRRSRLERLSWKHSVAKYTGQGIDLLANDPEHVIESADKKAPRISIKLDLVVEDHAKFMETVDEDILRMPKVKGADGAQMATHISGPLGIVLQKIVPIIDEFAGSHPVLKAAWIVLSSAYKVIQSQIKLDDAVRKLVEILREMAAQAAVCQHVGKLVGAIDIIAEIGRTSLHVAWLIHRYADPSIMGKPSMLARVAKLSASKIPSDVEECSKRCANLIDTLQSRVQIETNAGVIRVEDAVQDVRVRVIGNEEKQKKKDIYKWMGAPDSSDNYNAALEKRQAETGSWFLKLAKFKEWKKKPGGVLWLDGGPGCGKTITCAISIENIIVSCTSRPSGVGYAYFFFDGTSARTELRSHESLLKSIIRQLADRCDGIPVALDKMYRACSDGGTQPSRLLLEETLLGIVNGFDVAYIVIDSLDECAERPKVLKWIQSIISMTAGKLHMLVTSRPEWDIKKALLSLPGIQQISIADNQAVKKDIRRFIDGRLSELPEWREERKKKVGDVLMRDANGMFRWVALQFDALMECESEKELDKQLHSLPQGLNATYARIFERSTRPVVLKRFLQWLAYSRSAMTVQELADVALIDFDSDVPVYDVEQRYDPNAVLRICSGFVSEIGGKLKLAHFSVNEYLVSLEPTDVSSTVEFQRRASECTAHSIIAQTCLAYLQHFDKPDSITVATMESFPLAQYAADRWIDHFHSAFKDINNDAALQKLVLNFFRPVTRYALINWTRMQAEQFDLETDMCTPLFYYACHFGLTETARYIINPGTHMNAEAGYATGLVAASRNGHLETVKLLVENGPHIDTERGEMYGVALCAASSQGHLEIVELLVASGAHISTECRATEEKYGKKREQHGTALVLASLKGHLGIVDFLTANGVDLNTKGEETERGHSEATEEEYSEVADDISLGEDNARRGTALMLACFKGHCNIFEFLAANGADLNIEGEETKAFLGLNQERHGTALVLAFLRGELDTVKFLAENGADLNTAGVETIEYGSWGENEVRYGTALVLASLSGNLDIVKILVENGALLDTEGEETVGEDVWHGTAQEAASAKGHHEIVELLAKAASDRAALQAAEGGEASDDIPAETGEVDDEHDETPEVGGDGDESSISANADLAVATLSFGTYHHILIIISLFLPILLTYWMYLY